jgi:NADPH-dependent 2,4-dienoyl-CoA reductase/sulfur reductase-like enzyme
MLKHVILGAGPAGVIASETIRKHAPNDAITIIGDESEAPYSRMAIPYLIAGNIAEAGTHLRHTADHYARLKIDVRRDRAASVDVAKKAVVLASGETHAFDRLLIATGSQPAKPPIPGIDRPGIHTCWTLADARSIMALAKPGARVLQMGAGFIGCIIMEALAARGVALTVVEMGDRMVPRMMGPTAGGMIKAWCEKKGIRVVTGAKVNAIEGASPLVAKLSTGLSIEADLVINATGVKPAIGFLENSGVKCLLGVLTDEHMQTNVAGVYAAGDCAEAFDSMTEKTVVSAIQPNAADQARIAALNMVGIPTKLPRVTQINVLDTLGMISTSFGDWQGVNGGDHVELTDEKDGRHLSLQFKGDVLVGCNSVGWTDHVGVMRGLVEGRVKLGAWKDALMRDPTQLAAAYIAAAQAQSQWSGANDTRRR